MGKLHKVVWPRGKNLAPAPRGRMPVQAIPGPRPKPEKERRQKTEYRLSLSKGHYPRGEPLMALPIAETSEELADLTQTFGTAMIVVREEIRQTVVEELLLPAELLKTT